LKQQNPDRQKKLEELKNKFKLREKSDSYLKNLFIQWGIRFSKIEDDKDFAKIFEHDKDKPNLLIEYRGKKAAIDFISKHDPVWIVDKQTVKTYNTWIEKLNLPLIVVFFAFDERDSLVDTRAAKLGTHVYVDFNSEKSNGKQNVEFTDELPIFDKVNMLKLLDL